MRDFVALHVNGRRHEVRGPAALAPLSTYLRRDLGLTGAKVVCAEGDCGACAVLVGRPAGDELAYRPLTSCIAFVWQFDGAHVVTAEGLRHGDDPNPVQRAMVTCHGAQCGYCTPGFVVAMCGALEQGSTDLRAALAGNLCRCTGYESILAAGRSVDPSSVRRLNGLYPARSILDDLKRHESDEAMIIAPSPTPGQSVGSGSDQSAAPDSSDDQSALIRGRTRDGAHGGGTSDAQSRRERRFFKPRTLSSATAFKASHPECVIVGGATDVGVQVNKGVREPLVTMTLTGIPDLHQIRTADTHHACGANVTLAQLESFTRDAYPELHPMFLRHGSPLIRNAGTLAGNIANASSIGDALPALSADNAEVDLASAGGTRRVDVNDFYTGYRQTAMAADELIVAVHLPRLRPGELLRLYKVSKRHDLDISTFTAAIWAKVDGDTIRDVRIAYGGVAPTVVRLPQAEAFLRGRKLDLPTLAHAGRLARQEIRPISDVRGSADYRAQLAENILQKFYHDVTGDCAAPATAGGHR